MAPLQDLDAVRSYFRNFGEVQAPKNGSPLYAVLSLGVLDDPELLEIATRCAAHQPSANLLFAAVHARLLSGDDHPLRAWYPDVLDEPASAREPDAGAVAAFRDFVLTRVELIEPVLQTRTVQTNVVRRTTCLVPAFALVARRGADRPLALLELGCSAGLNLHWDRYRHRYMTPGGDTTFFGDPDSPLELSSELAKPLPPLPAELPVAWRAGIDLHPIDPRRAEERLWLRALVFPEHVERHRELETAAAIAGANETRIETGDATTRAPALVAEIPMDCTPCIYASMVLNQMPREARADLLVGLEAESRRRPLWLVTMDGNARGTSDMRLFELRDGRRARTHLAEVHSHGRWLAWDPEAAPARA